MPLETIKTPCIGFCEMVKGLGICYGCGRRIGEISAWSTMPDSDKDRIMEECKDRLNKLYGDDLK